MSYVLAHLAATGALAAAFGLGGYAISRALHRGREPEALRSLARAVLGVVTCTLALFTLACLGALGTRSVVALGVACGVAAGIARWRFGPASSGQPRGGDALPFLLAAGVVTAPLLLIALTQEVSWDASSYHLTLPRIYLGAGGFVSVPLNVYSVWPLGTELLYAAAMAISDHASAKALHAGAGLATLWAAWLGARELHRPESGWLAVAPLLASPIVRFEWSVAYVDLAYAFFFLAGLIFASLWRASPDRPHHTLWLAGLCGGALAATKVTGVLGAIAIAAVLAPGVLHSLRQGRSRDAAGAALRFGLPVLLLWLPWLVRAAVLTGNPFYPAFHGVFGGPDWSATLSQQFSDWQRGIGMGRSLSDYALLPLRVIRDGGAGYGRFDGVVGVHWLVVLPFALFGLRNRLVRGCLLGSAVYFVLWAAGSQQARFLIPILPPLALAGSIGALELIAQLPSARTRQARIALGVAAAALLALAMRQPVARAAALLPEFARGAEALRETARRPVDRFVATLPPDATLLLLNTNQGFFLERPYLADSFFEASQIADWLRDAPDARAVHARLSERGISHVVRSRRGWGIAWPDPLDAMLLDDTLAMRRFHSVDGGVDVFELR